jgi:hypothetical protein
VQAICGIHFVFVEILVWAGSFFWWTFARGEGEQDGVKYLIRISFSLPASRSQLGRAHEKMCPAFGRWTSSFGEYKRGNGMANARMPCKVLSFAHKATTRMSQQTSKRRGCPSGCIRKAACILSSAPVCRVLASFLGFAAWNWSKFHTVVRR